MPLPQSIPLVNPQQNTPTMAHPVTELVYFQLKSTVKPEDPANEEGQALLDLFNNTKQQSGYQSSAWGRTKEDENIVVWVIGQFHLHLLFCLPPSSILYYHSPPMA